MRIGRKAALPQTQPALALRSVLHNRMEPPSGLRGCDIARKVAEISHILDEMEQDWERDLLADVPAPVREGVRSRLADWARRFGLSLPDGASARLEAHIASLVQDYVDAIAPASGKA